MRFRRTRLFAPLIVTLLASAPPSRAASLAPLPSWAIAPFVKAHAANPVLSPGKSVFVCPIRKEPVAWESDNVFNPAAVTRNGLIYVLYRAEDASGEGVGRHTSRIGLAYSRDGRHFTRRSAPVLFPDEDAEKVYEWPGGCEDPRVVETDDGRYVLTYTMWNRQVARLAVATSRDLVHWQKHGPAFAKAQDGRFINNWSKSGAIVTRREGDHFIATRINGRYWMYWGEGTVFAATSTNLTDWSPVIGPDGDLVPVLKPRPGLFDSNLAESGPPAVLTGKGIVLIYNGKNDTKHPDPRLRPGAYSAGQALMDPKDPVRVLDRTRDWFITPETPYERTGQYAAGTVFTEGLAHKDGRWWLYYGTADSHVAAAFHSDPVASPKPLGSSRQAISGRTRP